MYLFFSSIVHKRVNESN